MNVVADNGYLQISFEARQDLKNFVPASKMMSPTLSRLS